MFSDGSDQAYGTCAYVRWQLENGTFGANLLAAKSRVTPIRNTTIEMPVQRLVVIVAANESFERD
jgi:hypothetical protein